MEELDEKIELLEFKCNELDRRLVNLEIDYEFNISAIKIIIAINFLFSVLIYFMNR